MAATTAVVLAGGASRRMGSDKRVLRLFPVSPTFLARSVSLGKAAADRVAVIGGSNGVDVGNDVDLVLDRWPGEGPLGALVTAFGAFSDDRLLVLAIDYPLLQAHLAARLLGGLSGHDAAVAVDAEGGRRHPLVAAYDAARCADIARMVFDAGERSMTALVDRLAVHQVGPDEVSGRDIHRMSLGNVNSEEDLETLRRLGGDIDRATPRR